MMLTEPIERGELPQGLLALLEMERIWIWLAKAAGVTTSPGTPEISRKIDCAAGAGPDSRKQGSTPAPARSTPRTFIRAPTCSTYDGARRIYTRGSPRCQGNQAELRPFWCSPERPA